MQITIYIARDHHDIMINIVHCFRQRIQMSLKRLPVKGLLFWENLENDKITNNCLLFLIYKYIFTRERLSEWMVCIMEWCSLLL